MAPRANRVLPTLAGSVNVTRHERSIRPTPSSTIPARFATDEARCDNLLTACSPRTARDATRRATGVNDRP